MEYHLYIFLIIQLMRQKKASVALDGKLIQIVSVEGAPRWRISAKVSCQKNIHQSAFLKECFSKQTKAFFHTGGSFLHKDETGVHLVKEVDEVNRYATFRKVIKEFLDELHLWSEVYESESDMATHA